MQFYLNKRYHCDGFFTNDDKFLVFAVYKNGIRVWSIRDKKQIFKFSTLEESETWLENNPEKRSELLEYFLSF